MHHMHAVTTYGVIWLFLQITLFPQVPWNFVEAAFANMGCLHTQYNDIQLKDTQYKKK
jgi:hypothetical protein